MKDGQQMVFISGDRKYEREYEKNEIQEKGSTGKTCQSCIAWKGTVLLELRHHNLLYYRSFVVVKKKKESQLKGNIVVF